MDSWSDADADGFDELKYVESLRSFVRGLTKRSGNAAYSLPLHHEARSYLVHRSFPDVSSTTQCDFRYHEDSLPE